MTLASPLRGAPARYSRRRLHFYTLNQAEPTLRLWKNLGLPVSHGPGTDSP
ncbi:MAG TPA: hypothetical protein VIR56_07555 [Solimonas sp.]